MLLSILFMFGLLLLLQIAVISYTLVFHSSKYDTLRNVKFGMLLHIFLILTIIAILEEALFRGILRQYIDNIHVVSILFGQYHWLNLLMTTKQMTISQVVCTTLLGYIIYPVNNIFLAICYHVWYNITNILIMWIIAHKFMKAKPDLIMHTISHFERLQEEVANQKLLEYTKDLPKRRSQSVPTASRRIRY